MLSSSLTVTKQSAATTTEQSLIRRRDWAAEHQRWPGRGNYKFVWNYSIDIFFLSCSFYLFFFFFLVVGKFSDAFIQLCFFQWYRYRKCICFVSFLFRIQFVMNVVPWNIGQSLRVLVFSGTGPLAKWLRVVTKHCVYLLLMLWFSACLDICQSPRSNISQLITCWHHCNKGCARNSIELIWSFRGSSWETAHGRHECISSDTLGIKSMQFWLVLLLAKGTGVRVWVLFSNENIFMRTNEG